MHERSRPKWSGPRSNRGYVLLKVETVEDAAWVSQPEAARRLGVTLLRVAVLIVNRRLIPAENAAGLGGVGPRDEGEVRGAVGSGRSATP